MHDALIGKIWAHLMKLLRARGRTPEDSEDLIQEAFLKLQKYVEQGNEVYAPEAFLVRTVQRLSMNDIRDGRRNLYSDIAEGDPALTSPEPAPEDILDAERKLQLMVKVLDSVSVRTREVFFLHRGDGLSYKQIAKLYGMTPKAVERRIAHAMLTLANKMPPE